MEPKQEPLRVPQLRVLRALFPQELPCPKCDWPLVSRAQLGVMAGYTAISGSITRALNGIRAGSSSGDPQTGLIEQQMVEIIVVDIDGVSENNYRITTKGIEAYQKFISSGGRIPKVKDAFTCTNDRYIKSE